MILAWRETGWRGKERGDGQVREVEGEEITFEVVAQLDGFRGQVQHLVRQRAGRADIAGAFAAA